MYNSANLKGRDEIHNFLLHHLSVYYMLMACFYNSLTGVFAKLLGAQISSLEVVLFRNLPGLLILLYKIKARPRAAGSWRTESSGR